jgi:hypothetical protein
MVGSENLNWRATNILVCHCSILLHGYGLTQLCSTYASGMRPCLYNILICVLISLFFGCFEIKLGVVDRESEYTAYIYCDEMKH